MIVFSHVNCNLHREINIKSLLNDGAALVKRLHRPEIDPAISGFANKPIFQDLAENADKGYTKIANANKKIMSVWNDIETQLRQCYDLRNFQSRVDEVRYCGYTYIYFDIPAIVMFQRF